MVQPENAVSFTILKIQWKGLSKFSFHTYEKEL